VLDALGELEKYRIQEPSRVNQVAMQDFGGEGWRPHFGCLIEGLDREGQLTIAGGVVARTELLRALRQRLFLTEEWGRDPTILEDYRTLLLENDPADYVRQCRAIASAENLAERLSLVTQPALVVVGGSDNRTLPEHGRQLAKALGDARVVEPPDVGHTLPLEAPEATAAPVEPVPQVARTTPEPLLPDELEAEDPEDHFMADDDMRGSRDGTTH